MPHWTIEQDEILIAYANLGASEVRKALLQMGVKHTEAAVIKRASRIGVTLIRYEVCPECGRKVKRLSSLGMCQNCTAKRRTERTKLEVEKIRREIESDKVSYQVEKTYTAARVEKHRLEKRKEER